jgi:predicted small lipoprotein YifL
MITSPKRLGRNATLGVLLAVGIMACGQRGPLELPEKLRPIQRIEPPPASTPETQDDEQKDER